MAWLFKNQKNSIVPSQAFYPDYFERRERRKQEFIDRWNKQYGTPTQEEIDEALWFVKPH